MLIFDITIAGISEAKLVIVNEKKKIIIIEKGLISLGISSKKYMSLGNISTFRRNDKKTLMDSMFSEKRIPKIIPKTVAIKPIVKPVKKKDFTIELLLNPNVFKIAISLVLFLIKNKTKEIAILKTLGLSDNSIIKSFFLTGFTIGLVATVFGIILGILFSENIESIRVFLSYILNIEIFPSDVYFLEEMPSELNASSIIIIFIFSLATTSLASLVPAIAISRMNTIKALKYE